MLEREYEQKSDGYFQSVRHEMLQFFPMESERVLDVGCGAGILGSILKERKPGCEVWGVEFDRNAARLAESRLDRVFVGGIEEHLDRLPTGSSTAYSATTCSSTCWIPIPCSTG